MPIVLSDKKEHKLIEKMPNWLKDFNSLFYYFLFLFFLGMVFLGTSLFTDYFTTPFTGDYCAQQISFYTNGYDDWWHFFKTGEFNFYDTNTFLGVDNIGANSFYYLFDPFFFLVLFFPRSFIAQAMAIITIIKICCAALTFYAYMRYMKVSRNSAKIAGIAYAFSGWTAWYLWFNHFTEITVILPLMFLGIEKILQEKRPWILMVAITLMGFTNFFFLLSLIICAFIYAMFRFFQRMKDHSVKDNLSFLGIGFFAFLGGLMMSMMVVLPSALYALNSPRANNNFYLEDIKEALGNHDFKKLLSLIFVWTEQGNTAVNNARYFFPFINFMFPSMSDRGTPLMIFNNDSYDNTAGNIFCFIPNVILLVPAFIDRIKRKQYSVIVATSLFIIALFTPFCYYALHGFTQVYSRWNIFFVFCLIAFVGMYLDKLKDEKFVNLIIGVFFALGLSITAIVSSKLISDKFNEFEPRIPTFVAAFEIVYILILGAVLLFVRVKKTNKIHITLLSFISLEVALMGAFTIYGHGVEDYMQTNKGYNKNIALSALTEKTKKNDPSYYRSYSSLASGAASNDGMRNNYNGLSFFHSVYNYNTADICNYSSITGGTAPGSWGGSYVQKRINLDTLLGVKYYYIEDDYYLYQNRGEATSPYFSYNVPFDYVDVTNEYPNDYFRVYKNNNYIDFALSYDNVYETYNENINYDQYDGLYTYGKDVLSVENNYLTHAIINSRYSEEMLTDLKNNYPSISVNTAYSKTPSALYNYLRITGYSLTPSSYADAILTYFDIYSGTNSRGEKVNSLGLTAKEYIDLCTLSSDAFNKSSLPEENGYNRRYVATITPRNGSTLPYYDPLGNVYYINIPYYDDYGFDVYFVDENNQIITYDNHNDGYYSAGRAGKGYRAFYLNPVYQLINGEYVKIKDAPKVSRIIIAMRNLKIPTNFSVYEDSYSNHIAKINALKQYPVEDVEMVDSDHYRFKTNYASSRVVVTRLAFEKGFKLKAINEHGKKENIPVYNAQGGFVSFIAKPGLYRYELSFYNPYLSVASLLSDVGIMMFVSSLIGAYYIDTKRKEKELLSFHFFR